VRSKTDEHLGPGKQIINNGEYPDGDDVSIHQVVDTTYSKEYFRKLKGIITDHEQTQWLSDKMKTIADQVKLYKCSGKKCNAVFSRWKLFLYHMNTHCHIARKDASKTYTIAVAYKLKNSILFHKIVFITLLVTYLR